uniref:Uncharacterized protein n=1 Tax=Solanum lycopersicum TaxID=4081 RepID=A0A3Q7J5Z7_SOLLC
MPLNLSSPDLKASYPEASPPPHPFPGLVAYCLEVRPPTSYPASRCFAYEAIPFPQPRPRGTLPRGKSPLHDLEAYHP